MPARKIAFYYQPIARPKRDWLLRPFSRQDDLSGLIELHIKSFRHHGWEPIQLDEKDAQAHPLYDLFNTSKAVLGKSKNPWPYTRACYMRWLAYANSELPFADFDVINYGFTPHDADQVFALQNNGDPVFLSMAGAVGIVDGIGYEKLLSTYVNFIRAPATTNDTMGDVNDMTIMQKHHPEWFKTVPYADHRFAKDFTLDTWREAKMVHFPYHFTPRPRIRTILAARPPVL